MSMRKVNVTLKDGTPIGTALVQEPTAHYGSTFKSWSGVLTVDSDSPIAAELRGMPGKELETNIGTLLIRCLRPSPRSAGPIDYEFTGSGAPRGPLAE